MKIVNSIISWALRKRNHQMELFMKYPHDVQSDVFDYLIKMSSATELGKKNGFKSIKNYNTFSERVPVSSYEDMFPYIDRIMKGEQNLLWPTEVKWFAKSSGTTNARSKFIPVTTEALEDCHFKGGKDMLTIYVNNYPETELFDGKGLGIGGSHQLNEQDPSSTSYYGDVSAVIMQNLPVWAQIIRTPSLDLALMDKWEEKIDKMARVTGKENVTSLSGVPTWAILLMQKVVEVCGKKNILDVWPNLEVFFHGAVAFGPYKDLFHQLIPKTEMRYMETYNASEGFFGLQDQVDSEDLLLMLDYGIFYEFIPMSEWDNDRPKAIQLSEVELGVNYAIIISTNSGLWRYKIGDTVKFTSLDPFRIKITGRTKHFINAFGEEVIIENAESAISSACSATGAILDNFTAAPVYLDSGKKGSHEWVVEFSKLPDSIDRFSNILDESLRQINSDYDAKRYKDMALEHPRIHVAPQGTFYKWMKKRGKLGGQHKVPRLANNREFIEDVLEIINDR